VLTFKDRDGWSIQIVASWQTANNLRSLKIRKPLRSSDLAENEHQYRDRRTDPADTADMVAAVAE